VEYVAKYHPQVLNCLRNFPHFKERFKKKRDHILKSPIELGEPLQGNLNGLRSFPFAGNFIIVYIVCEECRRLQQQDKNRCLQCGQIPDNAVIFLTFGPHDPTYFQIAPFIRERLKEKEFHTPSTR